MKKYFSRLIRPIIWLGFMLIFTLIAPAFGLTFGLIFWAIGISLLIKQIRLIKKQIGIENNGTRYPAKIMQILYGTLPGRSSGWMTFSARVRFFDSAGRIREEWIDTGVSAPNQRKVIPFKENDTIKIAEYLGELCIISDTPDIYRINDEDTLLSETESVVTLYPVPYKKTDTGLAPVTAPEESIEVSCPICHRVLTVSRGSSAQCECGRIVHLTMDREIV